MKTKVKEQDLVNFVMFWYSFNFTPAAKQPSNVIFHTGAFKSYYCANMIT